MFFGQRYTWCTIESGAKPPEAREFSRIFVLKVTLQSGDVTFNCKLQKKNEGAGCATCSPDNFVGGAATPDPYPVPAPVVYCDK